VSALDALVDRAAEVVPCQRELAELRGAVDGAESLPALFERAEALGEIDAQIAFALLALAEGQVLPRERVQPLLEETERFDTAAILALLHPETVELLEEALRRGQFGALDQLMTCELLTDLDARTPLLLKTLRHVSRHITPQTDDELIAMQVVHRLQDPVLLRIYQPDGVLYPEEKTAHSPWKKWIDAPGLALLPEQREVRGHTAYRVQPKVGRNDPCPCGSGKKYKKCCAKKAGANALSAAQGVTRRELRRAAHRHLDLEELAKQPSQLLFRLPYEELDEAQLRLVHGRALATNRLADAQQLTDALEALGADTEQERLAVVRMALDLDRPEVARAELGKRDGDAPMDVSLRLRVFDGEPFVEALDAFFQAHEEDAVAQAELVLTLLKQAPSVGLALAPGQLDPAAPRLTEAVLDGVEDALMELRGDYEHPIFGRWEQLRRRPEEARSSADALRLLQEEVGGLREQLEAAQRDARATRAVLQRQREQAEAERAAEPEGGAVASPVWRERARAAEDALRAKRIAHDYLKQQHSELQSEVRRLTALLEVAERESMSPEEPSPSPAAEPASPTSSTPEPPVAAPSTGEVLRVPVWSARAQENLERLPQHVAEAALGRIHDLSLGSPNAWRQAKRLQDLDGLMSTRVGIHYRVLFRMEGRRIEVEEVLSREAQARAIMRRR
jgi:hypothetical protein